MQTPNFLSKTHNGRICLPKCQSSDYIWTNYSIFISYFFFSYMYLYHIKLCFQVQSTVNGWANQKVGVMKTTCTHLHILPSTPKYKILSTPLRYDQCACIQVSWYITIDFLTGSKGYFLSQISQESNPLLPH